MRHTTDDTERRSDPELITLVRGGDRDAYGVLYGRHSAAAVNLARQFTRNPAEVDDLVAEAFAKVLSTLLAGGGPDMAFRAYLFTTLRHTAVDRGRRDAKVQFTDDLTPHERPAPDDDPVVLKAESTIVARAFASLPQRWQTVLWHTQVEQQPPAEVGLILGMTPNAVTSLAFRAREGLREAYLQAHLAEADADPCRATVARLGSWARGGLSSREQAQVDEHLDSCDRCRALAAELQSINTSLRALIGPVILGAAAVGYFATSSAAAVGLTVAGAAASGAGAAGGGGSGGASGAAGGGASNLLTNPWTWVTSGVAASVVTGVVLALTVWGGSPPDSRAEQPAAPIAPTSQVATGPSSPSPAPDEQPTVTPPAPATPVTSSVVSPTQVSPPPRTRATSPPSTVQPTITVPDDRGVPVAPPPVTIEPAEATPASSAPTSAASRPATTPTTSSSASSAPTSSPSPTAPKTTGPDLSAPQVSASSISSPAGAPVTVDFSVTNSGDTASPTQRATIGAPGGVTLADAGARSDHATPAFHRHAAFAAEAAEVTGAAGAADHRLVRCRQSTCHYSVPARSTLTVTLTFAVAPDAHDGRITITTGRGASAATMLSVSPALTNLTLGRSATTLRAGETHTDVPITAAVTEGVTDPGTITLPIEADGLWITDHPDDCVADRAGTSITCAPASVDSGVATFGPFAVSVLPRASGIAHVPVALPGGRSTPLMAAGAPGTPNVPLAITPQSPGDAIDLTGPFGGTLVGAPAMECNTAGTTRGMCQQDGRAMTPMSHPQQVTVPPGATVISATLTWAMTYPEGESTSERMANLAAATFHIGAPGCTDACTAHRIDPAGVYAPVVNDRGGPADTARQMYVRATDVTQWVTGSATLWADGLRAVTTTPLGGSTPMAGWTLSVIWSRPGADATVHLDNTGTDSLSDGVGDHLTLAPAGAPITDLTQVLWATDPQAVKRILVDGVPVDDAPMFGYHSRPEQCESHDESDDHDDASEHSHHDGSGGSDGHDGDDDEHGWHDDHGDHSGPGDHHGHGGPGGHSGDGRSDESHESDAHCVHATGMDVVTGITAPDGQAVTFTNDTGDIDGNWVHDSTADLLWLGPTLTVRDAS